MSSYDDWIGRKIPDHVMEEAASWMALLDSDECNTADRVTFARWLSEDSLHQAAFHELSEIWARLHTLVDVQHDNPRPDVIPFPVSERGENAAPASIVRAPRTEWSTLAAAMLVVVGVCMHWIFGTPEDLHRTTTGEVQTIALADGSTVDLNAKSSISVQIDDRRRELRLEDGEAVFHVKPDTRPFVVRTDLAVVSAVGTRFSVRTEPSVVEVSVIEGLVSVSSNSNATALTEYEGDSLMRFTDEVALLGRGQKIELTRETQRYLAVSEQTLDDELSWRNGEVVFSDAPLVSVLNEMRRYHSGSMFVGDPVLNTLRISGRFPTDDVEVFLDYLDKSYGITVDREAQNYVVLRLGGSQDAL